MALAQEVATKGVTVNTVSPGYVGTDMVRAIRPDVLEKLLQVFLLNAWPNQKKSLLSSLGSLPMKVAMQPVPLLDQRWFAHGLIPRRGRWLVCQPLIPQRTKAKEV